MIISHFMVCALLSIAQGLAFLQMRFIHFPLLFFMAYISNPHTAAYFLQCVSIICGVWIIDNAMQCEDVMVKYSFALLAVSNMFSSTNKLYEIVKVGNFSYIELFFVSSWTFLFFVALYLIKLLYNRIRTFIKLFAFVNQDHIRKKDRIEIFLNPGKRHDL